MFDFDSFKARLANTHFGHTWKTTCQSTCEEKDASKNSSYWWGEKRKSPTFWLLLKAEQNLLLSRISGKLLLIIGYYTVYRNCKCSLQTTHHTHLIVREGGQSTGTGVRQNMRCLPSLPVAEVIVANTKVTKKWTGWAYRPSSCRFREDVLRGSLELPSDRLKEEGVTFIYPPRPSPLSSMEKVGPDLACSFAPTNVSPPDSLREDLV